MLTGDAPQDMIAQVRDMMLANPGMSVKEGYKAVMALPENSEYAKAVEQKAAEKKKAQAALQAAAKEFTESTGVKLQFEDGSYFSDSLSESVDLFENRARFHFSVPLEHAAEAYNAIKPYLK
jgi:hypothetical protein